MGEFQELADHALLAESTEAPKAVDAAAAPVGAPVVEGRRYFSSPLGKSWILRDSPVDPHP